MKNDNNHSDSISIDTPSWRTRILLAWRAIRNELFGPFLSLVGILLLSLFLFIAGIVQPASNQALGIYLSLVVPALSSITFVMVYKILRVVKMAKLDVGLDFDRRFRENILHLENMVPMIGVHFVENNASWFNYATRVLAQAAIDARENRKLKVYSVKSFLSHDKYEDRLEKNKMDYLNELCGTIVQNGMEYKQLVSVPLTEVSRRECLKDLMLRLEMFGKQGWKGNEYGVKQAPLAGMDMVITHRAVLFSFTTEHMDGAENNIRKGLLIEDEKIVATLIEWFEDTWRKHSSPLEVSDQESGQLDEGLVDEIEYFDSAEVCYLNYQPEQYDGKMFGLDERMWREWKGKNTHCTTND